MSTQVDEVRPGGRGAVVSSVPRVFISYDRRNLDAVKTLAHELDAMGHAVWFDQDIAGGHRWWDSILLQIRECDLFIFALSPESVESHACRKEMDYASRLRRGILPVLVAGDVNENLLPQRLSELQYVDYRRQDRQTAFALMRAMNSLPMPSALPDPLPEPPSLPVSHLGALKERIDETGELRLDEQVALVFKLKEELRSGRSPAEARGLLLRLKARDDLRAKVATEIEAALAGQEHPADPTPPQSAGHDAIPPAPAPSPAPAEGPVALQDVPVDGQRILRRVLEHEERWILAADGKNEIALVADRSSRTIAARAEYRDDVWRAKEKALKALGWSTATSHRWAKGVAGGTLLYATSGVGALALLSGTVRDYLMNGGASRAWPATAEPGGLALVAAEVRMALQAIAPGATMATARREPAPPAVTGAVRRGAPAASAASDGRARLTASRPLPTIR